MIIAHFYFNVCYINTHVLLRYFLLKCLAQRALKDHISNIFGLQKYSQSL